MKLSDLLTQKLTIDNWNITPELIALDKKLSDIRDNIRDLKDSDLAIDLDEIDEDIFAILNDTTSLVEDIDKIKITANTLMQQLSKEPLNTSYDMYDERKDWFNLEEAAKYRSLDQFVDNEESEHKFVSTIRQFSSWHHATVYVRPNSLRFFNALKASDVFYVMEQCDVTGWLKENLPGSLYETIRFKQINENKEQFLTNLVPKGQIGLIVMEHFINFKPMDVIRQYLAESFELLKPGGHLLFTYNNCDLPAGARNFEEGLYCYTPGVMLGRVCECAGFEIVESVTTDRVSWFALKKPGTLTSLKGGKTLGQIVDE